ncbi:unnamed protein product [Coregonus sp. 'balchen']|nr:unnamed protein product [Coregonus sp. 'balchen']
MVIKDKTSLSTGLYRKPTDRNTLLRGDSFHPRPLIKSLSLSQFSRIRRNMQLRNRPRTSYKGLRKGGTKTIGWKVKEKAEYSPLGKAFKDIIRKHWYIIDTDPQTSLRYIGIEMVKMSHRGGDIERKLLQRESFWIHRLNTLSPLGLNEEFDLKPFL